MCRWRESRGVRENPGGAGRACLRQDYVPSLGQDFSLCWGAGKGMEDGMHLLHQQAAMCIGGGPTPLGKKCQQAIGGSQPLLYRREGSMRVYCPFERRFVISNHRGWGRWTWPGVMRVGQPGGANTLKGMLVETRSRWAATTKTTIRIIVLKQEWVGECVLRAWDPTGRVRAKAIS